MYHKSTLNTAQNSHCKYLEHYVRSFLEQQVQLVGISFKCKLNADSRPW